MMINLCRSVPRVGELYELFIPGEPRPKSTQKPPNVKSKAARNAMIFKYDRFKPLRKTLEYQAHVASLVCQSGEIPEFDRDDPIRIGMVFCKGKHGRGDLKNLEAAVEDALKYAGVYGDDDQIQSRSKSEIKLYQVEPGVHLEIQIDPGVLVKQFLLDWLGRNKKKTLAYQEKRMLA